MGSPLNRSYAGQRTATRAGVAGAGSGPDVRVLSCRPQTLLRLNGEPEWALCRYRHKSHLIRDYQDAAETYPDAIWPAQAQRALRGLIKAWHLARDAGQACIPAVAADPLITEFRRAVTVGLSAVPRIPGPKHSTAQHPGRDLLEFCRDREDDVLRFTTDTRIWPTNNISERGVRPAKTQQKISGRLTSEQTTQDRLDIRSYIDTARKHDDARRKSPELLGGIPHSVGRQTT